jgi:hypothetical protein
LSKKLVGQAESWLDQSSPLDKGTKQFLDELTTYKRGIDRELHDLGIKDTNLRQPVVYPMQFHEAEYSHLDEPTPDQGCDTSCNFSVRDTEAM